MRSNHPINCRAISSTALLILALSVIWVQPARAQSQGAQQQDIQQLRDKLQQLDQMMNEVKAEIGALEGQKQTPGVPPPAMPPPVTGKKTNAEGTLDLYGYVMLDAGQNFQRIDPNWFDVMRPTKLPAFSDEFLPDGTTFFGVRQTRFGVRTSNPTKLGDLKTLFEFELFGTGVDAGQTTFRLRHAYGELGHFGAGQTWSPFMDIDVFPNSIE